MAKKIQEDYIEDISVSADIEIVSDTTILEIKDPLADTVKTLVSQGWDDNRIAAKLMISKTKLNSLK